MLLIYRKLKSRDLEKHIWDFGPNITVTFPVMKVRLWCPKKKSIHKKKFTAFAPSCFAWRLWSCDWAKAALVGADTPSQSLHTPMDSQRSMILCLMILFLYPKAFVLTATCRLRLIGEGYLCADGVIFPYWLPEFPNLGTKNKAHPSLILDTDDPARVRLATRGASANLGYEG